MLQYVTMSYAVIKSGGKQHTVRANESFITDKLSGKAGDKITFDEVLLYVDGDNAKLGMPFVSGVTVEGRIVEQTRGEKIRVAKFKAKSRYRKVRGFRAELTEVMIESIKANKKGEK